QATVPQAAGAAVPFSLGRYRVTERVGAGGFGTVYKAADDELARQVAIKVFHADQVSATQDLNAYQAEGRALASLDHPGIVPIYDVGRTDSGLCYLVSKFVEGGNLKDQLRRVWPTRAETVEIVSTIAEALHSAHQHRIVHRDVKPANILLDTEGPPYIAAFAPPFP